MAKRQPAFPGMEPPTIKEVEEAAEDYEEKRDKRMEHTKREVAAAAHLLNMLEKHNLTEYKFDGKKAFIVAGGKKVKVRTLKEEKDEGDDDKEGHTPSQARSPGQTVREAGGTNPAPRLVTAPVPFDFDVMVVGEIVEEHNETMNWFYDLPGPRQRSLYEKKLASPPRKGGPQQRTVA